MNGEGSFIIWTPGARLRYSHENPDVKAMYEEFFEKPNSHKAHLLLHTEHRK